VLKKPQKSSEGGEGSEVGCSWGLLGAQNARRLPVFGGQRQKKTGPEVGISCLTKPTREINYPNQKKKGLVLGKRAALFDLIRREQKVYQR